MKRHACILFTVLACVTGNTFAHTAIINGIEWSYCQYHDSDTFATIGAVRNSYYGPATFVSAIPKTTEGKVIIPSRIDGHTVGAIAPYAFEGCSKITEISIPSTVTSIPYNAFSGCSNLVSVSIPNSVTRISEGDTAVKHPFAGCPNITSVTLPGRFKISKVFPEATITNLEYAAGTDVISNAVPTSVVSVSIGRGVKEIKKEVFVFDAIREVHITDLKAWCGILFSSERSNPGFSPCSVGSLGLLNFHLSHTQLYLNDELIRHLEIPDGTTEVSDYAFSSFQNVETVSIPDSVTRIGKSAFMGCNISSITLGCGLKTIDKRAFAGCSDLTAISIPTSCETIAEEAFRQCTSLRTLVFSGATDIALNAFNGCSSLSSIDFGSNVSGISQAAFSRCTSLPTIAIPGSVESIGINAFSDCTNLVSVEIQNGVQSIEGNAFSGCSNLVSVSTPDSVQWIGGYAFKNCSSLSRILLPPNLRVLGRGVFNGCSSLSFLRIPDRIFEIDNPIASDCPSLKALVLPMSYIAEHTSWQNGGSRMGVAEEYEFFTDNALSESVETQGDPVVMYVRKERQWKPVADSAAADGFVLKSEQVETNSVAEVRTTVVGPGTFSFDWKISAGRGDYARVYLDDVLKQSITRSSDWASLTFELTEGEHTFTWLFQRGGGEATGEEAAFLDNVGWFPRYTLEVVSEEGIPSPQPGTTSYVYGAVVNAVVETPDPVGGVRHVCTGWTGKGSVPSSGTGTNVTFTIEDHSRITWNWKTQNQIALVVEGGTCSFGTQWIDDGATVSANIVPSPHLYSISLSGDTNGVSLSGTTIAIPSDRPRNIIATVTETKLSFDVTSQFGTTSPSTGRTEWSWNETIAASATPNEPVDGTRRVCTGWTGTGSVPSSGTESMVSFAIQDNSSIVWNWRTEHFISFQTDSSVSAEFSEAWKTDGETIVVDYTLLVSYAELELAGDVDGVTLNQSARTVTIPVNRPRNVILRATKVLSLPEALDAVNLPWTTDEGFEWIAQTTVSADGEDAAKSAGISGSQTSGLETTVRGPGTLRWKYKLDAVGVSGLDVILDGNAGSPVRSYEESCHWTADSLEFVDDVTHTIRFEFWNAGSSANDCAYLDMVSWNGGTSWLEVTGVTAVYDGTPKSVSAEASFLGGATAVLRYALAEDGPYSETNPSFTDAGTNTVWVVASAEGADPITNNAQVVILPKALDPSMACVVPDQVFDGTPKTPELHIRDGWPDILSTEDYTVRYEDNTAAGTARIVVEGRRNYAGTIEIPFGIDEPDDTRFLVVDLSGGTNTAAFPVSYLPDIPAGGWTDEYKTTKLVLRKVPAGSFRMGSSNDTVGRQVTLTRGFHVGVFEVTQKQWELVMGTNVAKYVGIDHPVEMVSYNMVRGSEAGAAFPADSAVDASSFLGVLRAKTGLNGFDLPTEAQWEYACRAETETALNSGKELETAEDYSANVAELARYSMNCGTDEDDIHHAVVGSYIPNRWGLYDMHGNVWEWCLDWYSTDINGGMNPNGASSGSHRLIRGGHWNDKASNCTSSSRGYNASSYGSARGGFRLVCGGFVPTTWFVDGPNGDDANDGLTWATAKKMIQNALDCAIDGDEIVVAAGVYKETESATCGLNNEKGVNVLVRSADGPLVTAIDGDATRRVIKGTASSTQNSWKSHALTLDGFTIRNGFSSGVGIAAYCIFRNCIVTGNTAGMAAGLDFCRLENCLVFGNAADAATSSGTTKLFDRTEAVNCTVTGNGIANTAGSSLFSRSTVFNSVIYGNTVGAGTSFDGDTTVSFSCSETMVGGTGNIAADPKFVDAANGNYRLEADSPCIDAGAAGDLDLPFDLDGNPRVKGRAIDMGCYEFQTVQTETTTTPVPVPFAWLDKYPETLAANGGDYEAFGNATAANGADKVWQCYVSGVNPTNAAERFLAQIAVTNGTANVWWTPDLNEGGTKSERVYTVEGKANLVDESWGPTNESTRFFRVKVSMP